MINIKTGIYIRVSTEEQVSEGYSIDAQKQKTVEYCEKNNYQIVNFYIDEGFSGKSLQRPKITELIEDVKKRKLQVIVTYRLDRLTRSLKDLANMLDLFEKYDVVIKSVSEELDVSSLSGRAMVQMLGVFAEFERGSIAERVQLAREQRAREGFYTAPGKMLGYDYDPETQNYIINESEAKIVRELFDLYISGKGAYYICRYFNEKGYRTINNKKFYVTAIKRIIKNGWYYCGKFLYQTKDGKELLVTAKNIPQPILSEETYIRAKEIFDSKSVETITKHPREPYFFKGKLRCAACGGMMWANTHIKYYSTKRIYHYYKCCNRPVGKCKTKVWLANHVENLFLDFLKRLSDPSKKIEIDLNTNEIQKNELTKEKELLNTKLKKEFEKRKNLQMYLLDNTITKEDYLELAKEIENSIEVINNEINDINEKLKRIEYSIDQDMIKELALNLVENWSKLNDVQKKEFVDAYIKAIYIDSEKIVKIEFIE